MTPVRRIEAAHAALARAAWTRGASPVHTEDDVIDLLIDIRRSVTPLDWTTPAVSTGPAATTTTERGARRAGKIRLGSAPPKQVDAFP